MWRLHANTMPCCIRNKRICRSLLSSGINPHVDLEDDGVADEWLVKEPRSKASLEPSILTVIYRTLESTEERCSTESQGQFSLQ